MSCLDLSRDDPSDVCMIVSWGRDDGSHGTVRARRRHLYVEMPNWLACTELFYNFPTSKQDVFADYGMGDREIET